STTLLIDSGRERRRMAAFASDDSNTDLKTNGRAYRSVARADVQWCCMRFHRVSYMLMWSAMGSDVSYLESRTALSWSKKEEVFSLSNLSWNAVQIAIGVLWVASKISQRGSIVSRKYAEAYW